MGYTVYMKNAGAVASHVGGSNLRAEIDFDGKAEIIPSTEPRMEITYNYRPVFIKVLGENGLREIHGKTGAEVEELLEQAVAQLGVEQSDNYWDATPGNVGAALDILLDWARQYPEGMFHVV